MSEQYNDDDLDLETEEPNDIRSLRKAASSSKKLRAELDALKREIAFAKAGIPMNDPRMSYFIKGYDGELDPETIRETAMQAGFIAPPQEGATPAVKAQQQQNHMANNRIMAASAGATAEDISEEAALSRMESAMNEGGMSALIDVVRQYGIPTTVDY
jgi:hypothetical protein